MAAGRCSDCGPRAWVVYVAVWSDSCYWHELRLVDGPACAVRPQQGALGSLAELTQPQREKCCCMSKSC